MAAHLSLPALLLHIVDAAQELVEAGFAAIVVLGHDEQLEHFVHAGMDQALLTRISLLPGGRGILDLLAVNPATDPSVVVPGVPGPVGPGPSPPSGSLCVPIQVGNATYGNLYLRAAPRAAFSAQDEQLISALAGTAGVAIANSRLLAESEQRRRWLSAAGLLTNELLASNAGDRLTCVTRAVTTVADADFSTLTVPHGLDLIRVVAVTGAAAARLIDQTMAADGSPLASTIRTGAPTLLAGYSGEDGDDDIAIGPKIIVPLSAGSEIRGALTIGRHRGRNPFTSAELDMAASFGVHAAVALALADARDTQINEAQVDDHDRIALDMHDHVMGELFAVGMGLQGLAAASRQPGQAARLGTYVDSLDRVITAIRTTIFQLQPRRRDPAGLGDRLHAVAEMHTDQLGYRPQLHLDGLVDHDVPAPLAADVLAVTREGLSNCARHADASQVDGLRRHPCRRSHPVHRR